MRNPFRYFNSSPEAIRLTRLRSENGAFITGYFRNGAGTSGEVLEVFATKRRDRKVALKFLERMMKRYGRPGIIVTDRLRSYGAAPASNEAPFRRERPAPIGSGLRKTRTFSNSCSPLAAHS